MISSTDINVNIQRKQGIFNNAVGNGPPTMMVLIVGPVKYFFDGGRTFSIGGNLKTHGPSSLHDCLRRLLTGERPAPWRRSRLIPCRRVELRARWVRFPLS